METFLIYAWFNFPDGESATYNICITKNLDRAKNICRKLNDKWYELRELDMEEDEKNKIFHELTTELNIKYNAIDYEDYSEEYEFAFERVDVLPELEDKLDKVLNEN